MKKSPIPQYRKPRCAPINVISENRREEGQEQTIYVAKESGMLKIHVQNHKSRIFDKVHLKVCFIRSISVTEGLGVVIIQMEAEMGN